MTNNGFVYFATKYNNDKICRFEQDGCDFFDLYDLVEALARVKGFDKYELAKELISGYGCTFVSKRPYISFNQVNKYFTNHGLRGLNYEVENEYGGDDGI